jgi:protein-tyrosine-phosphatase
MRSLLFVCVGNAGRSQMAEAFARHHAEKMGLRIEVRSGGTLPAKTIDAGVLAAMSERGLDLSGARPRLMDLEFARTADLIVSLCGPLDSACPAPLLPKVVDWATPDPKGAPPEVVRGIRDAIERRVVDLLHATEWSAGTASTADTVPPDTSRLPDEIAVHAPAPAGLRRDCIGGRRKTQ